MEIKSILKILFILILSPLFCNSSEIELPDKYVERAAQEHTNNWAVLVDTSRFWFNYRHVANVLSIYRSVKRLGIPDSQIILMVADDMACNSRNPRPATVFNNMNQQINVYGNDVEVDYRGYEVTVENFVRLLTGRNHNGTARSKRLLTDSGSNVLMYLTGHGGEGFLKFQDSEEITSQELANAIEQMWQKQRYHELFFMIDTCQAASMYEKFYSPNILAVASSLVGEDSLSHHVDPAIGVYIIDRYTYYVLEFLEKVEPNSKRNMAEFFSKVCPKRVCISTVGVRKDLYAKDPSLVPINNFFGSIRPIEMVNVVNISIPSIPDEKENEKVDKIVKRIAYSDLKIKFVEQFPSIFSNFNLRIDKKIRLTMDIDESENISTENLSEEKKSIEDELKEVEKTNDNVIESNNQSTLDKNASDINATLNKEEEKNPAQVDEMSEKEKIDQQEVNEKELQTTDEFISNNIKTTVKKEDTDIKDEIKACSSTQEIKEEDKKTPNKSETPEDIINLLKSLSPEKLKEIKCKVLEISENTTESSKSTNDADENKKSQVEPKFENDQKELVTESVTSTTSPKDDVICLDSDDDESLPPLMPITNDNNATISTNSTEQIKNNDSNSISKINGCDSKRPKECINPDCPRNANDEYLECPLFVMSMYYVMRKPNKIQWVCSTCHKNSIETYEKLCTRMLNNEPWFKENIPKKQDLVEILDSDDEDEKNTDNEEKKRRKEKLQVIDFDLDTEKEIEDIITQIASRINTEFQLEAEQKYIDDRLNKNDKRLEELQQQCKDLESKSYKMYNELYSLNRPQIQRRPSLDLECLILSETGAISQSNGYLTQSLPHNHHASTSKSTQSSSTSNAQTTSAPVQETPKICYAVRQRNQPMPHWMACKIIEDLSTSEEKKFKVQFCDNMANSVQIVSGKEICYPVSSDKLEIGARVIAIFPRAPKKGQAQRRFLPGVIGEKLTQYNKRRYLVFCDYGQVKYCNMNEVREIQEYSENVWEDVHPNLKQFIRDYLESKTNRSRALLNVRVNTTIMTERGGNWRKTIVKEVDCSLVQVYFVDEHITEWLYRGSKRLYTMFQQSSRPQRSTIQRRNDPAISYVEIDDDSSNDRIESGIKSNRNIAKKSTSRPSNQLQSQVSTNASNENHKVIILNDSNIYLEEPAKVAVVKHFTPKKDICPKKYVPHECNSQCIPPLKNNLSAFVPLAKPLLTCWERQILKHNKSRTVIYKAPCGRRLRNYHEVFRYFEMTKCFLNIENFDFDDSIQVLSSLVVDQSLCPLFIPDISNGKEGMKIQCINAFDEQSPPPLEYSPHRIPMPGVNINTDPEFMSCCDCTNECFDKSKCACFQLTIQGAKYKDLMVEDPEDISYVWKRLLAPVPTGIYECNSRCKCSKRCLNKVVQHPIQVKLQLYRTKSRGWGLQSLHDIPKGTFICIYAGNLYSEKDANALCQGQDHGDEYFAELDLIENAEARKDGYESGVVNPDESDQEEQDSDSDYDDKNDSHDYDDGDFVSKSKAIGNREIITRSSRREKSAKSSASSTPQRTNSEDSSEDEMVNMMPNTENTLTEGLRLPFRKLYGPKEKVYIMDAKKCGNVGRYFNHSCDPNLFVQSVFVDTHDLRFPWISFFAMRAIKAGEELTWNYNYEVGSVPSKVLYCKCGAKNCRGRIL
ncbi:hypothetical protein PVAND_011987 [Polypedilum vanderplanki]|uniref:Histone-lysine N-methyltransferase eggless n=1 Tax=Polypedilum vanderplanki TaxID=319348 RepID=A0A9J6CL36_POLVA|nr:hypothetical protein PVAND_011987 [Polypedilum vanderplanki]